MVYGLPRQRRSASHLLHEKINTATAGGLKKAELSTMELDRNHLVPSFWVTKTDPACAILLHRQMRWQELHKRTARRRMNAHTSMCYQEKSKSIYV